MARNARIARLITLRAWRVAAALQWLAASAAAAGEKYRRA